MALCCHTTRVIETKTFVARILSSDLELITNYNNIYVLVYNCTGIYDDARNYPDVSYRESHILGISTFLR